MKSASLLPTSASTTNSRDSRSISSRLTSASSVIVPSEISTWRRPSSRSHAISPSTRPWRIAISVSVPPSTTGIPWLDVALELGLQVGAHERRAPAELDDVDAVAGDLQQAVDIGHRQPPVDHVGDAVLARLRRPRRDVQKAGYGLDVSFSLSAPTMTTTFAEPASAVTAASIGSTCVTEIERATPSASAWWPLAYSTTLT